MILDYLSPVKVYKSLAGNIDDLVKYRRYLGIIKELNESGKLDKLGIRLDADKNMYLGINLNPELLLYSETSQETVELKLISEKMLKHNDFLMKEGILDFIKVDYDRVQSETFYGYVIQISFRFTKYSLNRMIYNIAYSLTLIGAPISVLLAYL
jgi:hypothetical protein